MTVKLLIQNDTAVYEPSVEDGIKWSTERKGSPGKLTFSCIADEVLDIQEGNMVSLLVDGTGVFYGYIFKKSTKKDGILQVTCYDQLRYFKNKDTYCYTGKTAAQLLKMICGDFMLSCGSLEDTNYIIPQRSESNKTLFDIIQTALDLTLLNTKELYVLYDDFGKITLKNISSMKTGILIDEETGQDFDYESSIDEQTYNQIKLDYDNEKTGKREVYFLEDSSNIKKWGILQYYDTLKEGENGDEKAATLLSYYNKKSRHLKVNGAWGDIRVRAGALPYIRFTLGDVTVNSFMLVEQAVHEFKNNEYTMDLTLVGGDFIG